MRLSWGRKIVALSVFSSVASVSRTGYCREFCVLSLSYSWVIDSKPNRSDFCSNPLLQLELEFVQNYLGGDCTVTTQGVAVATSECVAEPARIRLDLKPWWNRNKIQSEVNSLLPDQHQNLLGNVAVLSYFFNVSLLEFCDLWDKEWNDDIIVWGKVWYLKEILNFEGLKMRIIKLCNNWWTKKADEKVWE